MYFEDLSHYRYYTPKPFCDVWNIGWLDRDHEYSLGSVDNTTIGIIRDLVFGEYPRVRPHVNVIRGNHPCNLCELAELIPAREAELVAGSSELWIPCRNGIFAAPSMLLHYLSYHNYKPPAAFLEALANLPPENPFDGQMEFELRNRAVRSPH